MRVEVEPDPVKRPILWKVWWWQDHCETVHGTIGYLHEPRGVRFWHHRKFPNCKSKPLRATQGDLFEWQTKEADAIIITTNGTLKANGEGVMGRGVAREAAKRWPDLPRILGDRIKLMGNVPCLLTEGVFPDGFSLVSLPVKHEWQQPADLHLIRESLHKLTDIVYRNGWTQVHLPRPGCGNGGLSWENVRPICEEILDDRFIVVNNEEG